MRHAKPSSEKAQASVRGRYSLNLLTEEESVEALVTIGGNSIERGKDLLGCELVALRSAECAGAPDRDGIRTV